MNMLVFLASRARAVHEDERGLNTAELLGNAALAIVALIAIWAALKQTGIDVVTWIADTLFSESLDSPS